MAAAKRASTATKKAAPTHPAYKDMIRDAITQLKDRNGSSRQALKKFIQTNYKINAPNFESLFNTALRKGVQTGDFVQPKGPSGTVKLKKKEPAEKKAVEKKPAEKKPAEKKAAEKKLAAKKLAAKKAAPKKAAAPKKETAAKKETVEKKPAVKKADAPKKAAASKTGTRRAAAKADSKDAKVTKKPAAKKAASKKTKA